MPSFFFLNRSSMQRRSSPSFTAPSSCYPIPHSQITTPPCTTSTNLLPKKIKSAALINEGDGWINSKTLISDSGVHTKYTTTESLFSHSLFGYTKFKGSFFHFFSNEVEKHKVQLIEFFFL
jgi:hypothetical protein